jgi:alpha-1,6-mannosyltransferase
VLAACGGTIAVAMLALAFVDARHHPMIFIAWALVAGAAYLIALDLFGRLRGADTRALALCLVLAAIWRVPLLLAPPRLSTDVYRYVWDGRLQRLGEDPYRVVPDDAAVAHLHTGVTRQLNNGWVPTIYPPGAELFFRAVTAVEESARAMKGALILCDGLVVLVVLRILAVAGLSPWWVLAYAWNPLVALEGAGNGHVDLLGTLAIATAAWAVVRKRPTVAALAFAFAVGVKLVPIVLAPLLWRRVRVRDALAGVMFLAALYVPFVHDGVVPLGSLRAYLADWRFNAPLFAALAPHASPTTLAGVAALAGLAVAAWARTRLPDTIAGWAWPVATALALAPSVYPWYLLWLTPFLFAPMTRPLAVWTVAILPTYVALHLEDVHGTWGVPWWLMTGEYGAVVIATALTVRRVRWRESTAHFAEVLAERDGMDPRHAGGSSATPPSP